MNHEDTNGTVAGESKNGNNGKEPVGITRVLDTSLLGGGRIVVVGLGGIGSFLVRLLALFLAALRGVKLRLVLVDGDVFVEGNRERMEVPELENKALVLCERLSAAFGRPGFTIRPVDDYVSEENVSDLILDGDIVFSCVDNHATRKLLSDHCATLRNVALISGGNDGIEGDEGGTYGNVQLYRRENGRDCHPPLTAFHPEIREPHDDVPEKSCEELLSSAPQIVFANFTAAACMGNAFFRLLHRRAAGRSYDEACFDILEARMQPHWLAEE